MCFCSLSNFFLAAHEGNKRVMRCFGRQLQPLGSSLSVGWNEGRQSSPAHITACGLVKCPSAHQQAGGCCIIWFSPWKRKHNYYKALLSPVTFNKVSLALRKSCEEGVGMKIHECRVRAIGKSDLLSVTPQIHF